MKNITISIPQNDISYPIIIGQDVLNEIQKLITEPYTKIVVVTDETIREHYSNIITRHIPSQHTIVLKGGESEKNIDTVQKIWNELLQAGVDRKSIVINVGGGVITDMGGFAAATYMRGIDFIQVPTTLLAQVDASVGGKVGINFGGIKNSIGSFMQPKAVIIDTQFLQTLPDKEFHSGFAEIIKHGLIQDRTYFEVVTSKKPREFSNEELIEIITTSCEIKAKVVSTDEHETGLRKTLNFGHTIGHAIESLSLESNKPLSHGEAIAIGMVAEAKISELQGFINPDDIKTIEGAFKNAQVPIRVQGISKDSIVEKMQKDKKNAGGKIKWTLLKEIGEADYNIEVSNELVISALEYISS